MIIGNKNFDLGSQFYMMGILNVTPDSFSKDGIHKNPRKALKHVEQLIEDGADIIDVGGESTRPGHTQISDEEEIDRICPVIEAIKEEFDIPVSLDTYKSKVAEVGIKAGADMINDIWGLKYDKDLASVVARAQIPICLMHNRENDKYEDLMDDIIKELEDSIEIALEARIAKDRIMIDPGIGFAKDTDMNLSVLKHLRRLNSLGYPILLGTSRKSVIGNTLELPVDERGEGTITTSVLGLLTGCSIFRVHDVKSNLRALKMTEAIMQAK